MIQKLNIYYVLYYVTKNHMDINHHWFSGKESHTPAYL